MDITVPFTVKGSWLRLCGLGRKWCSSAAGGWRISHTACSSCILLFPLVKTGSKLCLSSKSLGTPLLVLHTPWVRGATLPTVPIPTWVSSLHPAEMLLGQCVQISICKNFLCLHKLQNHPAEPRTAGSPAEHLK